MSGSVLDAIAHPTTLNPLDAYSKALQVNQLVNANKAFQARQAAGQAYQAATDPVTGQVDAGRAQALIAADPRAALAAQESATSGQALTAATSQFNQQQQAAIGRSVGSVLTLPDAGQTPQNYKQALDFSLANHGITQDHYQAAMAALQSAGSDPAALRQFGTRLLVGTMAGPEMANAVLPRTGTAIGPGGTLQGYTQQPGILGGGTTAPPQAGVPLGLSPAEATTPTTLGVDPVSGAARTGTRQQFVEQAGQLGTGRLPAALRNPANAGPAPSSGAFGVQTSLGPAQEAAQQTTGAASAGAFDAISKAGTAAAGQNALLGTMLADAQHFQPGMDYANQVRTFVQRQAPAIARLAGIDPNTVSAQEGFDKLAAQIANAQGATSDARLAVTQHANPSSSLSPGGVDVILRSLQGNADYNQAKQQLAAAYPDKSDAQKFEATVGRQLDPRAFQFDRMTPQQQVTFAKSLSPIDQKRVQAAYVRAGQLGLLASGWTPGGAGNGQ